MVDWYESAIIKYFDRFGYKCTKLDIENTTREPDFLIENKQHKFYLEVKVLENQGDMTKFENIKQNIEDQFSPKIEFGYSLLLSDKIVELDTRSLADSLNKFQNKLECENSLIIGQRYQSIDGLFEVELLKKEYKFISRKYAFSIKTKERIRDKLRTARKQFQLYKFEKYPRVFLLAKADFFSDECDMFYALFGNPTIGFSRDPSKNDIFFLGKDAFFNSSQNKRISVAGFADFSNIENPNITIFHNPFANCPLPFDIFTAIGNKQIRLENDRFFLYENGNSGEEYCVC